MSWMLMAWTGLIAVIFIVTTLLINPLVAIFLVSIMTCVLLNMNEKNKDQKELIPVENRKGAK